MQTGQTTEAVTHNAEPTVEPQRRVRGLDEAICECQRELDVRKRCFATWVEQGRLSAVDARDRFDRLLAAIKFLKDYERVLGEPNLTP
jgi:hypothetical protein